MRRWTNSQPIQTPNPHYDYHAQRAAAIERFERAYVRRVLKAAKGNKTRASLLAGIDRVTFHRLLDRLEKVA